MLEPFKKTDMLFQYNWSFQEVVRPPEIITDTNDTPLNRTEGYEMIHFITSLVKTCEGTGYPLQTYQNIEKIIRLEVPDNITTYGGITHWIISHYDRI